MEGRIVFKNGKSLEISTSDDTKGVSILKSLQLKYTSLNQDFYNRLKSLMDDYSLLNIDVTNITIIKRKDQ